VRYLTAGRSVMGVRAERGKRIRCWKRGGREREKGKRRKIAREHPVGWKCSVKTIVAQSPEGGRGGEVEGTSQPRLREPVIRAERPL